MRISRSLLDRILGDVESAPDTEICGLLLGTSDVILDIRPARNVAPRSDDRFEIDPQVLFDQARAERAGGLARIGHYHSHPNGRAEPSQTDALGATGEPDQLWMIVAAGVVSLWRADAPDGLHGCFARVALEVA